MLVRGVVIAASARTQLDAREVSLSDRVEKQLRRLLLEDLSHSLASIGLPREICLSITLLLLRAVFEQIFSTRIRTIDERASSQTVLHLAGRVVLLELLGHQRPQIRRV